MLPLPRPIAGLNSGLHIIEQTNDATWFGIYSVIRAGKELREMTPEEMQEAIACNPDKPVEMPIIRLKSRTDAGAEILANVK